MTNDLRTLSSEERARRVVLDGKRLWGNDVDRRARYLRNLCRYEGRVSATLIPAMGYAGIGDAISNGRVLMDASDPETWLRVNVSRSLVRAVTSKIAAVQQPKVAFVTSGADWSVRRKSRLLDQFVEGSFAQQHKPYSDVWDLGAMVFRDTAIFGIGAIKTWADKDAGRICRDRILPWELLWDYEEAQNGDPAQLWHTYRANRTQLKAWFPELGSQLENAPADSLEDSTAYVRGDARDMVRCWEYWRQFDGPDSPGCHTLVVQGVDTPLIDNDELVQDIPISFLRWDREVRGFGGTSLLDEACAAEDEYNLTLCRMARSLRATSMGIAFVPEGSIDDEAALDSEDCLVIKYKAALGVPQYISPAPFGAHHSQWAEMWRATIYDTTGVNQMSATGVKQTGADSGTALKTLVDMQSEIFATAWRNYQLLYVDLARKGIEAGRALAEDDPEWSVSWAGEGFLRSIPWSKVDLASDQYVCQIQSAPSSKGTAFERTKTGEEAYGAGMISRDALLSIKQYYDTPGEMDRASRQRRIVDQWIERWLDADDEQIDSGEVSEGEPLVPTPIRWMALEDAIVQVADGYMQAMLDGAPEANRGLFLAWLENADAALQQKNAKLAAANAPSMPPQPPSPMAGAMPELPQQPLPGGMP